MSFRIVRAVTAMMFGFAAIALCGCARTTSADTAACAPRLPHVSQIVVRPGTAVTISASAALCRPRFDHGRRLSLEWQDRAGLRRRLATATAFSSGAFEQTVKIPAHAAVGPAQVSIRGFRATCADAGSCASYEIGIDVVDSAPDFATSQTANRIASDVAAATQTALQHRKTFFEVAIVPDGIEVVLDTTRYSRESAAAKRAFSVAQRAVPANERKVARAAHVHIDFIHHSAAGLEHLTLRIAHDSAWQKAHRIALSVWYPDSATDSVRIALVRYTDRAAILLTKRYGTSVTVATKNTPLARAD